MRNQTGHELFQRWAKDQRSYVQGFDLGYGGTVCARILDGKGTLLPGAPRGSGMRKTEVDPVAVKIDKFVNGLDGREKKVIKTYYCEPALNVDEKARRLQVGVRAMYHAIEKLQDRLVVWMYPPTDGIDRMS